ncbi:MAG: phage major capsid protein [Oscillospiraceae bacterium]|nr:phage major capsid protein [Oscillospiraceae bacterium]
MSYDSIRLEKGMYRESGKTFSQVLESLDPSEAYQGTALEGTDAFQRQLKRFGIRARGAGSDPVEKFFSTFESAVLFPEFIARVVRQGIDEKNILPSIVATVTNIDALDYRSIYSAAKGDDKALRLISEGASIPETVIRSKENLISLRKRGRMLVASYEALRFQKLDMFSVMLRQIGSYIQQMQIADAVDIIESGDGNSNGAGIYGVGVSPLSGTPGVLDYDQLVEFWSLFHPYEMNTILTSPSMMAKLLKLPEMQNPTAGLNFQGTGKFGTPLGAEAICCSAVPANYLIGLDRRFALEMVQAGDVCVEYDKLIDRQLERAAITTICGFGKIYDDAAVILEA